MNFNKRSSRFSATWYSLSQSTTNDKLDHDRSIDETDRDSNEFYSARVPLYSDETHACHTHCMLFALMKTLARNEERRNKHDK